MSLAGFDENQVYSSGSSRTKQAPQAKIDEASFHFAASTFREFLRNFRLSSFDFVYREKLLGNVNSGNFSLEVDMEHINQFNYKLYECLLKDPTSVIACFESSASELICEFQGRIYDKQKEKNIQIMLISKNKPIGIRDLQSKYMNSIVKVEGIVLSCSSVRSKAIKISIQCRGCKTKISNINVPNGIESYPLPRKCPTDQVGRDACPYDPFIILPDESLCIDSQVYTIQESPQSVPHGEMPRHLQLYLDRNLCDKVTPGNYILVSGIFSIKNTQSKDKSGGAVGLRAPYIKVTGLETLVGGAAQSIVSNISAEEEVLYKKLSMRKDIYDILYKSIAPSIYGSEDIKKSILCLLFGGSRKQMPDSLMRRGDINLLLLGDPGTAKSQMLKFVEKCAPISVYTSGKGSSAAGLTASVIRDGNSKGFSIEGGAMVLADGGVVCIDEFDKMREEDRVAIHETMEQQTISIAKAGITTTLNTRCSVFAAANSVFGRWDDTKGEKNIDFMPTILSRFDMIYIVKDKFNEAKDSTLAKHIVDLHADDTEATASKDVKLTINNVESIKELDVNSLKKYICYARTSCGPRLSDAAAKRLQEKYVNMRNPKSSDSPKSKSQKNKSIPITVRQLEALIRIAESLAKMRLAPFTSTEDVDEAIRLFHVSTLNAADSGSLIGVEGVTSNEDQTLMERVEMQLRKRFVPGSQVSISSIMQDFTNQNYPEMIITKALQGMVQKGEAQFSNNRKTLYRVR